MGRRAARREVRKLSWLTEPPLLYFRSSFGCVVVSLSHPRAQCLVCEGGEGWLRKHPCLAFMLSFFQELSGEWRDRHSVSVQETGELLCLLYSDERRFTFFFVPVLYTGMLPNVSCSRYGTGRIHDSPASKRFSVLWPAAFVAVV